MSKPKRPKVTSDSKQGQGASIKCIAHPDWQMRKKPTGNCDLCHDIWELILRGAEIVR